MLFLPLETTLHNFLLAVCVLVELSAYFYPQTGLSALHLAAQEGKVDVARLLIEAKAQVNIQTKVHFIM